MTKDNDKKKEHTSTGVDDGAHLRDHHADVEEIGAKISSRHMMDVFWSVKPSELDDEHHRHHY